MNDYEAGVDYTMWELSELFMKNKDNPEELVIEVRKMLNKHYLAQAERENNNG